MKLIAADYDGTLNYCGKVTEEDFKALQKWQAEGNLFVIDTGRSLESIRIEADRNGLEPDYFITNNGGMVFDKGCMILHHDDPAECDDTCHAQKDCQDNSDSADLHG